MRKKVNTAWVIGISLSLMLSACKPGQQAEPSADPQAVLTAAAETANARLTEIAAITPSPEPTATETETPTATVEASPTTSAPIMTPSAVVPQAGTQADRAEFVADVTVPDFSTFTAGQPFRKTWRVKNIGTSTWTPSYSLLFYSGNQMSGPSSVPLAKDVKPGETVDLSIDLVSPANLGQYTGYWILRNSVGQNFGVGPTNNQSIFVIINVSASGTVVATTAPITVTATLAVTPGVATPTVTQPAGGSVIQSVTLSADNANFTGACPHIFTLTAVVNMNQAATIAFTLQAASNTAGINFPLPGSQTKELKAGSNTLRYEMMLDKTVSGWVKMLITSPESVTSNQLDISLTCSQ